MPWTSSKSYYLYDTTPKAKDVAPVRRAYAPAPGSNHRRLKHSFMPLEDDPAHLSTANQAVAPQQSEISLKVENPKQDETGSPPPGLLWTPLPPLQRVAPPPESYLGSMNMKPIHKTEAVWYERVPRNNF